MPFGQIRVVEGELVLDGAPVVVDGRVVDGTVVEGTVVEGTVVDCGTVVVENGEDEGVVEGEMLGVWPTMLLPPAPELPGGGAERAVLPVTLGGVRVMRGAGVTAAVPGVVPTAPGAAAPAPGAPTW